jgi:hypothetical protein
MYVQEQLVNKRLNSAVMLCVRCLKQLIADCRVPQMQSSALLQRTCDGFTLIRSSVVITVFAQWLAPIAL